MNLKKYDLIILDCDGVIFNSNLLKIEAFKKSIDYKTENRFNHG